MNISSGAMTDLNILTMLQDALKKCSAADTGEKYTAVGKGTAASTQTTIELVDMPDLDKTCFPSS